MLVVTGCPAFAGHDNGDVILDIAGESVGSSGDLRKALVDARSHGKRDVLMRVKSADTTHFVAMPIG